MCGIFGYNFSNKQLLPSLLDKLSHRGPDANGTYLDDKFTLGHTRLSIIDTSVSANQTMISKDGKKVIIYNGELYNYKKIKKDLMEKGVEFTTNSDTEVVLNSIIEYNLKALDQYNGMFAFAFYDSESNRLALVRDKIGIKQVYYYFNQDANIFIFASEYKIIIDLLDSLKIKLTNNVNEIRNNLITHNYSDNSIFNEIKILLPAHILIYHK